MEKGVAPKPERYWHTAEPGYPTEPAWLPQAGNNLALDAKVTVSSTRPNRRVRSEVHQ
jgi:hypothetical protein